MERLLELMRLNHAAVAPNLTAVTVAQNEADRTAEYTQYICSTKMYMCFIRSGSPQLSATDIAA